MYLLVAVPMYSTRSSRYNKYRWYLSATAAVAALAAGWLAGWLAADGCLHSSPAMVQQSAIHAAKATARLGTRRSAVLAHRATAAKAIGLSELPAAGPRSALQSAVSDGCHAGSTTDCTSVQAWRHMERIPSPLEASRIQRDENLSARHLAGIQNDVLSLQLLSARPALVRYATRSTCRSSS